MLEEAPAHGRATDLSNELILEIFSLFPLQSLIAAQGVSHSWRALLPHILLYIDAIRRELFEFYFTLIDNPVFLRTRPWVVQNLRNFDRQGYIDAILSQHHYIPPHFRLWILEWPAREVIGCAWPGLPSQYEHRDLVQDAVPQRPKDVPGLLVWATYDNMIWLPLDDRLPEKERDGVWLLFDDFFGDEDEYHFSQNWLEEQKWELEIMEKQWPKWLAEEGKSLSTLSLAETSLAFDASAGTETATETFLRSRPVPRRWNE
ncbi:hypothetical protein C8J57DRAFT_1513803 [Mycena rebaudengoi]|nr:hypothetical protein C8J57DRAFT_1513803 [Mycena rebaudengoi]